MAKDDHKNTVRINYYSVAREGLFCLGLFYKGRKVSNGRDVRNYFEKVVRARVNRLDPMLDNISYEEFMTIKLDNLQNAAKLVTSI